VSYASDRVLHASDRVAHAGVWVEHARDRVEHARDRVREAVSPLISGRDAVPAAAGTLLAGRVRAGG
jgi:hypothetical protein